MGEGDEDGLFIFLTQNYVLKSVICLGLYQASIFYLKYLIIQNIAENWISKFMFCIKLIIINFIEIS